MGTCVTNIDISSLWKALAYQISYYKTVRKIRDPTTKYKTCVGYVKVQTARWQTWYKSPDFLSDICCTRGYNCASILTLIGPRIVIYSYSTINKMHLFLKLFILVKRSSCFGRSFHPSSGAQNYTYSNSHTSNSCCYLLLTGTIWDAVPFRPR